MSLVVLMSVPYDTPLDLDMEIILPRECLDFKYLSLGQVVKKRNVDPKTIHNHRSSSEGIYIKNFSFPSGVYAYE